MDLLGPPCVHDTRSELVPATDNFVAGDGAENSCLRVTWLESDRCTCGDVKSLSVGPGAIEGQARVGFDGVVVGSDLQALILQRMRRREEEALPGPVDLRCS